MTHSEPSPEPPLSEPRPDDDLGYVSAVAELDAIVRELDGADVDVDRLADRVRRAAELIALCRERIDGARLQIDTVIADLDRAAPQPGTGRGSPEQGAVADHGPA